MEIDLNALISQSQQAFAIAKTPAELENSKAQFLGKQGRITELLKGLASLPIEQKKTQGAAINLAKQAIEHALNERRKAMQADQLAMQLQAQALDVSLPGRGRGVGGGASCHAHVATHSVHFWKHGF